MSWILAIETSTEVCSVALSYKGETKWIKENKEGMRHAQILTVLIDQIFEEAGIDISELSGVAISKGPGSYTGLRIGTSVAKGICYALTIPLIAINTLQAMVVNQLDTPRLKTMTDRDFLFCPMIDARRMEVYCQLFDQDVKEQGQVEAKVLDDRSFSEVLNDQKVVFLGNGSQKFEEICKHPDAIFLKDANTSSSGMSNLAYQALQQKNFEDVAYFEPFYLKQFQIISPKKEK